MHINVLNITETEHVDFRKQNRQFKFYIMGVSLSLMS